MAYIDFKKQHVLVLNSFQATAYVNEVLFRRGEDTFGETSFYEAIDYGIKAQLITPLDDGQFKEWYIEPVSDTYPYPTEKIVDGNTGGNLYYVSTGKADLYALSMFNANWLKTRTYTLMYTEIKEA